ncbi:MAG: hypothetical protein JXN10_05155 [Clostridia bacterium]|nr:hypothetical protein [Clostridia bacterium]MBN2882894.1 hypothetical protein [Clostridia bacterium]
MNTILAGFSEKDISPEYPVPGRLGINHIINPHHAIKAKAAAIKRGNERFLFIVLEIVGLTISENTNIRKQINEETGIPIENIVITCTHTHASPWIWDLQAEMALKFGFEVLDVPWMDKVMTNAARAGIEALSKMSERRILYGEALTKGIVSNRVDPVTRWSICADDEIRNASEGIVDRTVRTLTFTDTEGVPLFMFTNLACHPTAYGGGKTLKVSPDFPYIAERLLKDKYNENLVVAYWQGCAGNINSGKYIKEGSEEEVESSGRRFFEAIDAAFLSSRELDAGKVSYKYEKFSLPVGDFVKKPDEAFEFFEEYCRLIKEKGEADDQDIHDWRRRLKQLDVSVLSDGKSMEMELQLLSIGDADMLFVPGEWYVQMYMGLASDNQKRELIVTTVNNFDLLYVPDEGSMHNREWYGVKTDMRSLGDESAIRLYEKARDFIS